MNIKPAQLFILAFALSFSSCASWKTVNSIETTGKNPAAPAGIYKGTLPCADCEGMEVKLFLKEDGSYLKATRYLGKEEKEFPEAGTYTVNRRGTSLTLTPVAGAVQLFRPEEGNLIQLDQEGQRLTGDQADRYILKKTYTDSGLEGKKWVLARLNGELIDPAVAPRPAFIQFEAWTSTFGGNGSCNSIFGPYLLEPGNRISFSNIGSTMMACQNQKTERAFLDALKKADHYSLTDTTLSLNNDRTAPLAVFILSPE